METTKTSISIPPELLAKIDARAKKLQMTRHGYIVWVIESELTWAEVKV